MEFRRVLVRSRLLRLGQGRRGVAYLHAPGRVCVAIRPFYCFRTDSGPLPAGTGVGSVEGGCRGHRHANAPVGSGQRGMARTMGLLSRPAGRLSRAVALSGRQAWPARLLPREPHVELPFVGVVVEEVVPLVASMQAVAEFLLSAIAASGFVRCRPRPSPRT